MTHHYQTQEMYSATVQDLVHFKATCG